MKLTKEQIEKMAEEYAEEQNSAYTNDYYGFIAGFAKALSLFAVSGSVCTSNKLPDGEIAISSKALQKPYGDLGQTDC